MRSPSPASPAVLAVDMSIDQCRFVGIRATPGERVHVAVECVVESEDGLWATVDEAMEADRQLILAVGGTLEVHVPHAWHDRYVTFGTAEMAKYTALVRSMIVTGKVSHDGSVQLAAQVCRAVALPSYGGALTLVAKNSPGPIEMARCMVVAVALASKPPPKRRPGKGFVMGQAR